MATLELVVNDSPEPVLVVALQQGGQIWIETEDLARLRLLEPSGAALEHEGRRYHALDSIRGASVRFDEAAQRVELHAPLAAFESTRIGVRARPAPAVARSALGAFLNYEAYAQRTDLNRYGASSEFGVFAAPGVLTHSTLLRSEPGSTAVTRLDTTFTRDFPEKLLSLDLGDVISDGGSYGNALRLGGLRFARNFELRPDLVTMPLLSSAGSATVPSTVDVLVNGQLVAREAVAPGPFVVDRLPTVSGAGEISLVVRDALGREQVMTSTFYASTQLLARGLTQYAFDVGRVRENYGLESNQYGELAAQGTWRRGITNTLTLELHGEHAASGLRNFGGATAVSLGRFGVLSATVASGGDGASNGLLHGFAFERRGRRLSVYASDQQAAPGYRQLGDAVLEEARWRSRRLLQAGVGFGRAGSLSLAWAQQRYLTGTATELLSGSYSLTLGQHGTLSATMSHALSGVGDSAAYLVYTRPLGAQRAFSASAAHQSNAASEQSSTQLVASLARSGGPGPGTDYRFSAGDAGDYDLRWRRRFAPFEIGLEASRERTTGAQLQGVSVGGALTLIGGELRASRSIGGGFALVDLAGLAGVPVQVENQFVARSDAAGRVLVTNLRAYEANRITVDPTELPLDVSIESPELIVVPRQRSGVVAKLGVRRIRPGTFRLVRDDGSPVPSGAWVDFNGERFQVALDGFVYVTNFTHGLAATASWPGASCRFRIDAPPALDPQPDMGVLSCRQPGAAIVRVHGERTRERGAPR